MITNVAPAAFWSRVAVAAPTDCWTWRGNINKGTGYGRLWVDGKRRQAHRIAYVLAGGSLTSEQVIDHLCRNRVCVNPSHLEATTVQINTARGIGPTAAAAAARLEGRCLNGHQLTLVGLHRQGRTMTCAECGRERVRRYKQRRQATR